MKSIVLNAPRHLEQSDENVISGMEIEMSELLMRLMAGPVVLSSDQGRLLLRMSPDGSLQVSNGSMPLTVLFAPGRMPKDGKLVCRPDGHVDHISPDGLTKINIWKSLDDVKREQRERMLRGLPPF